MWSDDLADAAPVALILGRSGDPVGTGFLIGHRLLATCAHTVAMALDADPCRPHRPYAPIAVDFPGEAGVRMTARVCVWVPAYAGGCGDIAVLELEATPPYAPVAVSHGTDPAAGHSFQMRCAADTGADIETVTGWFGPTVASLGTPELHVGHGARRCSDRCSGAPVFDEVTGRVIGMAMVCHGGPADRARTVVPIAEVLRVVPGGPTPVEPVPPAERPGPAGESEPDIGRGLDAEPVVGVYGLRTFQVLRGKLGSVGVHSRSGDWHDGTCVARCDFYWHRRVDEHRVPAESCSCGVYCFRDLGRLRSEYSMANDVVAVIALEGRVLEGHRGWRAEAARVVALWTADPATVDPLPDVTRYSDVEEMIRAYPGIDLGHAREAHGPASWANTARGTVPASGSWSETTWTAALFLVGALMVVSAIWTASAIW
ncbi:hypothetical protein AB0L57_22365 [Nocardia sp. NPDC052254]|uniref:trypsin-like peptidase domain-containing protein n=1 Tax=Nocardia sp. NPDC052254 TaxID=3155681 RepID=UPI0034317F57